MAGRLKLSIVGARAQLLRLMKRGLVGFVELRQRAGRPVRAWSLTDTAVAQFPDRHADLAAEFLRGVQDAFGKFGIEGMIEARGQELKSRYRLAMGEGGTLEERVQRLAALRSQDGYMASVRQTSDGEPLLIENHCPIQAAARQCPALCASELQLLKDALGEGVIVERVEHVLTGARRCVFKINRA